MQFFLFERRALVDSSLDSTTLESESSLSLFSVDFLVFFAAAETFFMFFGLQVFYPIFKEISHFFDGRVCIIKTLFNNFVFPHGGHVMVDDVHDFIYR